MNLQLINGKRIRSLINLLLVKNKSTVLTLILVAILGDIFVKVDSSDFRIFSILAFYLFSIKFYKLNNRISLIYSLIFLSIMWVSFILTKTSDITEKTAVWVFLFFGIGIIQQCKEIYSSSRSLKPA